MSDPDMSRVSELEASLTELADQLVKKTAECDKLKFRLANTENLLEGMNDKYLKKVDKFNKVWVNEEVLQRKIEQLEKQEESIRIRQGELEDMVSWQSKKRKQAEETVKKLTEELDGCKKRARITIVLDD